MQTLRQSSKDSMIEGDRMSNKHREGRIWYAIIVDRRITCTESVLTQGDKTTCSHTKIQYNNHSDILLRVQEEVRLSDNTSLRVKKMARVRVKGVRMTPRTRACLLYTSPSPRDGLLSRMPSSA